MCTKVGREPERPPRESAEESECFVVPLKPGNRPGRDLVEGRGHRISELREGQMAGTPIPSPISTRQAQIASRAREIPDAPLRTIVHHMDLDWLREAFGRLRRGAAAGVDGMTVEDYAANLDANLEALLQRLREGRYRAPPVRRVYIPKGDGSSRPLGLPTVEDKLVQTAVKMLIEPIYEQEFYDFSYGFRPGRSAHDAVEALHNAIWSMYGAWVLDADIRGFFDAIGHRELRDLLRQRVADPAVVRLVGKWLNAGVLEGGVVRHVETGSPQGGVISPLLANIYLHEALDKWWVDTVFPRLAGRGALVRYADDFVMVFERKSDAERVLRALHGRMARFGLELHPDKTKLGLCRPPWRGEGPKPATVDFLGFTVYWALSRNRRWTLKRKTSRKATGRALRSMRAWMKQARHWPIEVQAAALASKMRGHINYFGLPGNSRGIASYAYWVRRAWKHWLGRRSQRAYLTWPQFTRLLEKFPLPRAVVRRDRGQLRLVNH